MPARVLHQFPISHYCEKTRWHLDRKALSYSVRNLFPGIHLAINRRLAGQSSVPVLIDGPRIIGDSTKIALYLDETYPEGALLPEDSNTFTTRGSGRRSGATSMASYSENRAPFRGCFSDGMGARREPSAHWWARRSSFSSVACIASTTVRSRNPNGSLSTPRRHWKKTSRAIRHVTSLAAGSPSQTLPQRHCLPPYLRRAVVHGLGSIRPRGCADCETSLRTLLPDIG